MFTEKEMKSFENKILNMDCLDFLKKCPDNYFSLVLTDPPYGINMARTINCISHLDNQGKNKKGFYPKKLHETKDWDKQTPQKVVFDEIMRVSKNQIIFGGNYFADCLPTSRGWIFWDKKEHSTQGKNFADGELAWTSFDKNIKKYVFGWIGLDYLNNRKGDIKIHPTQKPADLFGQILRDYSNENDIILDCFSGSGTTAIACHRLNRRFICIERDYDYFTASVKRLEDEKKQLTLDL